MSSSGGQEHQLAVFAVKLVMTMLKYHVKQGCNKATTASLLELWDCVLEGETDGTVQPLLKQLLASGTALRSQHSLHENRKSPYVWLCT